MEVCRTRWGPGASVGLVRELIDSTDNAIPLTCQPTNMKELGSWDSIYARAFDSGLDPASGGVVANGYLPSLRISGFMVQRSAPSCFASLRFYERSTTGSAWWLTAAFDVPYTSGDVSTPFEYYVRSRYVKANLYNHEAVNVLSVLMSMISGAP